MTTQSLSPVRRASLPLGIMLGFWALAIILWRAADAPHFLFIFGYIGLAVGGGLLLYAILPREHKSKARRATLLMVGSFLLVYLGFVQMENLQIEWVWFSLLAGLTGAALIHYLIAKVIGPLVIGRTYCGWACYTLMILDLLPWKNSPGRVKGPWGWLRLAHFLLSLALVLALWFVFDYRSGIYVNSIVGVYWLIGGNILYYTVGVGLAVALRDNRAFCKYICPVTIFLKPGTCLSMLKISGDRDRCTACGTCAKNCPMDIEVYKYIQKGQRVLSTECTYCQTCVTVCPDEVLSSSFTLDLGGKDYLRLREHA